MRDVKAIVFDLDGTLVDSNSHYLEAYMQAFNRYGVDPPRDRVQRMYGRRSEEIVQQFIDEYQVSVDWEDVWWLMRSIFEERVSKDDVWRDGSIEVVKTLKDRYLLAVGTGTSRHSLGLMMTPGEQELFDAIVTSSDVERSKPDPETFILCSEKLGVNKSDCVVVGDTYLDMLAAKAAGMYAVGITTGPSTLEELVDSGADHIINNLGELPGLLED